MAVIEKILFGAVVIANFAILLALLSRTTGYKRNAKLYLEGNIRTKTGREYKYKLGDNLQSLGYSFRGMQLIVPFNLPTLFIDSHMGNKKGAGAPWMRPGESYRTELEGDFYTSFAIYTLQEHRRFVPYFLPPDVMHLLHDKGRDFDIDFLGREVSIIVPDVMLESEKGRKELMEFGEVFMGKLEGYLLRWHDEVGIEIEPIAMKNSSLIAVKKGRKVFGFNIIGFLLILILIIFLASLGRAL